MARLGKILVVVSVLVFMASVTFAAESIAWSVKGGGYGNWLQVTSVNTTAANGSLTTTALQDGTGRVLDLNGYYLYSVSIYYGATGPTDDSDLTLLEHTSAGKDVLHGAGADMIDNAGNTSFKPWVNGTECAMPIYGKLYQAVANNVVDTAIFTIVYRFIK